MLCIRTYKYMYTKKAFNVDLKLFIKSGYLFCITQLYNYTLVGKNRLVNCVIIKNHNLFGV